MAKTKLEKIQAKTVPIQQNLENYFVFIIKQQHSITVVDFHSKSIYCTTFKNVSLRYK